MGDLSNFVALIALFSLIVSFFAYRHSVTSSKETNKQIQKISADHLQLSLNIALGKASQKYVLLLGEVRREFENIISELAYPALEASRKIGEVFDKYDNEQFGHPYLRHAFHEAINVVRDAYDKELTYQYGANLTERIRFLKFIKKDITAYRYCKPGNSLFPLFKRESFPVTPERYINSRESFWDSVKTIYSRISAQNEPDLFSEALGCMAEYRKLHEEKRDKLKVLEERLDQAVKENEFEIFDIRDIPKLGEKFYRLKGDIDRYRALYFPDFHGIESVPVRDGIAFCIYAGSILFIASQHFMWGKLIK